MVTHTAQIHHDVALIHVVRRDVVPCINGHTDILALRAVTLADDDECRRAVIGDAIVLQYAVLADGHQRHRCRPGLIAVIARHHQLTGHHEVGNVCGVFLCHPATLVEESFLPDGHTCSVVGQSHTGTIGCGIRRTVDGFGSIPLCASLLLGVIEAIDTAGTLDGLVEMQAVFQVLLGNFSFRLLQHHEVGARHGSSVVVGASSLVVVGQIDGRTR